MRIPCINSSFANIHVESHTSSFGYMYTTLQLKLWVYINFPYVWPVDIQHFSIHTPSWRSRFGYIYTVLQFKCWYISTRYNSRFRHAYSTCMSSPSSVAVVHNDVHHWSTWAHLDRITEVKGGDRVYKRQFERLFGAYSLTNTHAMAVVGRPNMCGVTVYSRIQNTSIIQALWHTMTA